MVKGKEIWLRGRSQFVHTFLGKSLSSQRPIDILLRKMQSYAGFKLWIQLDAPGGVLSGGSCSNSFV